MNSVLPKKCYICNLCKEAVQYTSGYGLRRHFWAQHASTSNVFCNINGCPILVKSQKCFARHLRQCHPGAEWTPSLLRPVPVTHNIQVTDVETDGNVSPNGSTITTTDNSTCSMTDQNFSSDLLVEMSKNASGDGTSINSDALAISSMGINAHLSSLTSCNASTGMTSNSLVAPINNDKAPETQSHSSYNLDDDIIDEDVELYLSYVQRTAKQKQIQALASLNQLRCKFNLNQAAVHALMEWNQEMLHDAVRPLIGYLKHHFTLNEEEMEPIIDLASTVINPFQGIESEWMINKVMKNIGHVVSADFAI